MKENKQSKTVESAAYTPPEQTPLKVWMQSDQLTIYDMQDVVIDNFMTHEEVQKEVKEAVDFTSIQFKMAAYSLKHAQQNGEDLVLVTDKENTKIGIGARKYIRGNIQFFTIHQIALLLFEHLLQQPASSNTLKERAILKSVNMSEAIDYMAIKNEIKCIEILAGQESLKEAFLQYQDQYDILMAVDEFNHVLFPGTEPEESISSAFKMLLTLAAGLKKQRKTLVDELVEVYKKYRFYHEKTFCVNGEDSETVQHHIATVMKNLRGNLPKRFYNYDVRSINDYHKGFSHNLLTGKKMKPDLPKADILQFITTEGDKISIAPSEDYIKLYYTISMSGSIKDKDDFDQKKNFLSKKMIDIIQSAGKM